MTNPRAFTVSQASPAVFSLTAHGFTAGDPIRVSTTGALYTGLSASVTYYVIAAGLAADSFQVSTSVGGSAVNTSGSQSGTHTVRYFGVVGVGDGSTTFALPNDLGYSERAWDNGRGVDTGRVFGSYQADGNKTHTHTGTTASDGAHTHTVGGTGGTGGSTPLMTASGTSTTVNTSSASAHTHSFTTAADGNTEVTVKNVAYLPIIKY
jgi:hypothetical protein